MNEEREFRRTIKKFNHARRKAGKAPIQYAVDFGKKAVVSSKWSDVMVPIIQLLRCRHNPSQSQDRNFCKR